MVSYNPINPVEVHDVSEPGADWWLAVISVVALASAGIRFGWQQAKPRLVKRSTGAGLPDTSS